MATYTSNNPVNRVDPTGHSSFLADFAFGFFAEAATNLLWFDTPFRDKFGAQSSESSASLAGRVVADVGSIILGAAAIEGGADTAIGGTALSCLGDICATAPVVIAVGGVVAIEGAGVGVSGAIGLGKNLSMMAKSSTSGETADTIRGRDAHDNYPKKLGSSYDYNQGLPSGQRPDAVDWDNGIVRELKPNNSRAISRGWVQIKRYINELSELANRTWTGYVDTYEK